MLVVTNPERQFRVIVAHFYIINYICSHFRAFLYDWGLVRFMSSTAHIRLHNLHFDGKNGSCLWLHCHFYMPVWPKSHWRIHTHTYAHTHNYITQSPLLESPLSGHYLLYVGMPCLQRRHHRWTLSSWIGYNKVDCSAAWKYLSFKSGT